MTAVLIPLVDGIEEMEAVITVDILRRARWRVVSAGLTAGTIKASRGVRLEADVNWDSVAPDDFDVLVIVGGKAGVASLARNQRVLETVRRFLADDKWVAAVCAGPLVLQAAGVLAGRQVTCHPAVAGQLTQTSRRDEPVVVDGRLVTSQGPGTTFDFVLTLVGLIDGAAKAEALAREMVYIRK